MVSVEELKSKLAKQNSLEGLYHKNSLEGLYLLDLRGHKAFETDEIIVYCNGGIQSIYAVMFLTYRAN